MELKPCPFCGKNDIHVEQKGNFFWVECYYCGATSREHHTLPGVNILQSESVAEKYWNSRPLEDALRARIAELETALKAANEDAERLYGWALEGYNNHAPSLHQQRINGASR